MKKFLFASILLFLFIGYGKAQSAKLDTAWQGPHCVSDTKDALLILKNISPGGSASMTQTEWTVRGPSGNNIFNQVGPKDFTPQYITLSQPGVYTAIMCVTWGTTTRCDSMKISVYPVPTFSFKKTTDSICPGAGIGFNFVPIAPFTAGMVGSFTWLFGEGSNTTSLNPTNPYYNSLNQEVNHTVTLTITDTNGCTARVDSTDYVFIRTKPAVNYKADQTYFCFGNNVPNPTGTVNFINKTDTNSSGIASDNNTYRWSFGDGDGATTKNTSHTYGLGEYYVTLYATNQYGCKDSLRKPSQLDKIILKQLEPNYWLPNGDRICKLPDTIRVYGNDPTVSYYWRIEPTIPGKTDSHAQIDWFSFRNQSGYDVTGTHYLILEITDIMGESVCKVADTTVLYIYDDITPTITAADTNECDPAHVITFKNSTQYKWADDFGLGTTNWNFGDGTTGTGDTITHTYTSSAVPNGGYPDAGYGDYVVTMTGTTPYGCPIKATYQGIHIYRMRATAMVVVPSPMDPTYPNGCAPHYVVIANIPDSLVSSPTRTPADIVSYDWKLNYYPLYRNPLSDSIKITGSAPFAEYTYEDTGWYYVYLTLTNVQGCVHDVPVRMIMVGYPPITNFWYVRDTNCKPDIQIKVHAYDSVVVGCNPPFSKKDTFLVANAWANEWAWLDDMGSPIGSPPDSFSFISPNETGSAVVTLVSSHNGCATEMPVRLEAIGYVCPPVATIKYPTDNPDGSHPLFCDWPSIPFVNDSKGAIYLKWYAGDWSPSDDTANHPGQSSVIKFDTTKGEYISIGSPIDTNVAPDGSWFYEYSDMPKGVYSNFLQKLMGEVTLYLWAKNDGSILQDTIHIHDTIQILDKTITCCAQDTNIVDAVNSDTYINPIIKCDTIVVLRDTIITSINPKYPDFYNPCIGRDRGDGTFITECEHFVEQVILISVAKMNFTVNQDRICQGDSILFFDSTICSASIFGWGFKIDSVANTNSNYLEPWMLPNNNFYVPIGEWYPQTNYQPDPTYSKGQWITFTRPNIYRAVLYDTCGFGCMWSDGRTDTLRFRVQPRSVPDYKSFFNGVPVSRQGDTVCVNSGQTFSLQDASWSPNPYQNTQLTGWQWYIGSMSSTDQNPTFTPKVAGSFDVTLTVKNEYGCDSTETFFNKVLANKIIVGCSTQNSVKTFCNRQTITFVCTTSVNPVSPNKDMGLKMIYYWGDGDSTIIYKKPGDKPSLKHAYDFPNLQNKVYIKIKAIMLADTNSKREIGCVEEMLDSITIVRPMAAFDDDGHEYPCPDDGTGQGRTIQFFNKSIGRVETLDWAFGDPDGGNANRVVGPAGENYTEKPLYNYKKSGKYDITLVVTDSAGGGTLFPCKDTIFMKEYVIILGPRGSISYEELTDCKPLSVDFIPANIDPLDTNYCPDSLMVVTGDGGTQKTRAHDNTITRKMNYKYQKGGAYLPTYFMYKSVEFHNKTELCMIQMKEKDTIYVIDLMPTFDVDPLYCPDIPITFDNTSDWIPRYLPVDSLAWNFGNGDIDVMIDTIPMPVDPIIDYSGTTTYEPGNYLVNLTMKVKRCVKNKLIPIEVMEIPDIYIVSDTMACDGFDAMFLADTFLNWGELGRAKGVGEQGKPRMDESKILGYEWLFEDGTEMDANNSSTRAFGKTGSYPYILRLTFTPKNCVKDYNDTATIFVNMSPKAKFEPQPDVGGVDEPFTFVDKSIVGDGKLVKWFWDFGDGDTSPDSLKSTIEHIYTTTSGYITVTLWIVDENDCTSDTNIQIIVTEKLGFPSVFTPNRTNCLSPDGTPIKCEFRPLENKGFFLDFKLEIYDRWGMLVWNKHCEDAFGQPCPDYQSDGFWWDGTNKQGNPVANGVYYWVVYAKPKSGAKPFIMNGSVTIVGQK